MDLSDYFRYYEQECNIFADISLGLSPFYGLPAEQVDNLTRVYSFTYNNPYGTQVNEPPACYVTQTEHIEKSTCISFWEKWFGKGIPSNYKINPFIKRNTTILFNEEIINIFKYAFTKEKYGLNNLEISNTIKEIEPTVCSSLNAETEDLLLDVEPVCPKILENWDDILKDYASISKNIDIGLSSNSLQEADNYFSKLGLFSHFSDSSSDSDSNSSSDCDSISVVTVIPWEPNLDIPAIVLTTPNNVNISIDSTNFDYYSENSDITEFSSENFDKTRLYPHYLASSDINERVSDKSNIIERELEELDIETNKYNAELYYKENNRLNVIENGHETGWDTYFKDYPYYVNLAESSSYSYKDEYIYSTIKDLDILNVCLASLPFEDFNTFKPLVLNELYRQYKNNTLSLEDMCKVKSIIVFTVFDNYSCFKYINPDQYIDFLDDIDVFNLPMYM